MSFSKKTLKDASPQVKGLRALIRVDWNEPGDAEGNLASDYRIRKSLETIVYLQQLGCPIVIISHRGRPEGKPVAKYSLRPAAARLADLLNQPIHFIDDCISDDAYKGSVLTQPGEITVLENLRFHPEEEANDQEFAKCLSMMGEFFVQDGFGVVHRAHASTEGITHWITSMAGLLLEHEVDVLTDSMDNPKRPMVAILGGAKISDKLDMVNVFLEKADTVIVGGAMANTFMKAQDKEVGKSLYEEQSVNLAKQIMKEYHPAELILMSDSGVAVGSSMTPESPRREVMPQQVGPEDIILDVKLGQNVVDKLNSARTVVWNGTLGYAELPQFAATTTKIAEILSQLEARVIIGGGDTAGFIASWDAGAGDSFYHVSTGGGAALELMSGKSLPGVDALLDK